MLIYGGKRRESERIFIVSGAEEICVWSVWVPIGRTDCSYVVLHELQASVVTTVAKVVSTVIDG